jgi:IclR family acetate operon transcriptional repressor
MNQRSKTARADGYPGTQAVQRALTVLKAFTDSQPELGLTALSRSVGLNKATTYRLVTALEREGLVAKTRGADHYRLGPELIALGVRAMRSSDLRAVSRPELEELARETGETVTLEVLAGSDVLILDEVMGLHLVSATHWIGTRWHAYATSTGKAILAYLSPTQVRELLPARLPLAGRGTRTRSDLISELEKIRAQGYATNIEELETGFAAVGAPVFNHEGKVIAAISVGGPRTRFMDKTIKKLAPRVRRAAAAISQQLGFRP